MSLTLPTTLPVRQITRENYRTVTLEFENQLGAVKPGQFVMLWLPGVAEKPISVAYADSQIIELTISHVGCFSEKIQKVRVGDLLGLRGPFGNAFKVPRAAKKIILVGGGFGVAPLHFLAASLQKTKIAVEAIVGARNAKELLYVEKLKKYVRVFVTTDDGSVGEKGFTTEKLEKLLAGNSYASVYSCGPEVMMRRVAEIAKSHKIPSQLSLERFMKCGFGICGSCCLDDSGARVCADGTIFSGAKVLQEAEFGKYHRDSVGERV